MNTEIERLNQTLIDLFGIDTVTGKPIWRVCWSEDQMEMRHGTFTDFTESGLFIREVTETRIVPKYRQWIHHKFILERLVLVPAQNQKELMGSKLSYEPIWVFEDAQGNALPPKQNACEFIIKNILDAQLINKSMITGSEQADKREMIKYADPENCQEAQIELKEKRLKVIEEELYGDDSGLLGTTLNCGQSIIVPQSYEKVN